MEMFNYNFEINQLSDNRVYGYHHSELPGMRTTN